MAGLVTVIDVALNDNGHSVDDVIEDPDKIVELL